MYDPTCGSGSLLLKVNDQSQRGLSLYGQEMDNATSALARMNVILHSCETANIFKGNTLSEPHWKDAPNKLKTFDFAVANPPFSNKNWTSGLNPNNDVYGRFTWGIPPEKNGDYTFLLHILTSLKSTGKGAVILPHGVLFRGNAEANIRENLIKQGYIKGIIGLPANLFYGTGIPACIIVIDKEYARKAATTADGQVEGRPIFMIDASKGFMKDGNKNRLRSQDIYKVVEVFNNGLEIDRYSRLVPMSEIADNDYNLNIPRYIDSSEPEDLHDLTAHLQGGIPNRDVDALGEFWRVFPSLRETLFAPLRDGYSQPLLAESQVKNTILAHQEFKDFAVRSLLPFKQWLKQAALNEIAKGDSPKELIFELSDALLTAYANSDLLSKYDIFQILMDYWADVMQDDVYVLAQDGWPGGSLIRQIFPTKKDGKNIWKENHDFEINKCRYKTEVIPRHLVEQRYFADILSVIQILQTELDSASQELENFIESQAGEDDLLLEAKNDKDKVTQKLINARLKVGSIDEDERLALETCLKYVKKEAAAKAKLKGKQTELDLAVFQKYPTLTVDEIKTLIVDDKWLATLQTNIQAEIERVTQQLANRVKELEQRYSTPLPALTKSVVELSDKVANHLKAMGLEWTL